MANYVAIELRTDFDGTFTVSTYKKQTRDEAEKAYHSILTTAATSQTLTHSAAILNPEGMLMKSECYKHIQPEPEQEQGKKQEPEVEESQKDGER